MRAVAQVFALFGSTTSVCATATPPASRPAGAHPLSLDRTGIRWVVPFQRARDTAGRRHRLLMIKPVAFGTDRNGGW